MENSYRREFYPGLRPFQSGCREIVPQLLGRWVRYGLMPRSVRADRNGVRPGDPLAAFGAKLVIQFGKTPNHDFFEMGSSFTLGSASNGINPVTEPENLQIGTFAVTIPSGSFTGKGFGRSISPVRSMASPWMW
jgi:hypothetical protein